MNKVFLYLYPIEEYPSIFLLPEDELYDKWNIKRPFPILNECIQKRYRDKGYKVIFAMFPDKNIYGIIPNKEDKVIYTDISFEEANGIDENREVKKNFIPKYPNEQLLINQLGEVDELVIGGYHVFDCVKRVGEKALEMGINTTIDLEMTDLFFSVYDQEEYFNIEAYSSERFKEFYINSELEENKEAALRQFEKNYSSSVYGFDIEDYNRKK